MYLNSTSVCSLPTSATLTINKLQPSLRNIRQFKPLPPLPTSQSPHLRYIQRVSARDPRRQKPTTNTIITNTSNTHLISPIPLTTATTPRIVNSYQESLLEQMPLERASDFASHLAHYLWFTDLQNTPFWNFSYDSCQPRSQFKKFCRDVINATQVSHSVIALSLLYIYRMKTKVPPIQGHPGSEFRAFTVALMLANKFLDDNTYTNKTWSEVTNIPVKEINIMEMEFLSSLDFSLFVSLDDYYNWVYSIDNHIPNNDDSMNDDSNAPDCAISIPQAIDYNLQVQSQNNIVPISQPQQLVSSMVCTSAAIPMETIQQSSAPIAAVSTTSYKRSVDQAFVDGIITSPSKRSNASSNYSVYAIPQTQQRHIQQQQQQIQQQQQQIQQQQQQIQQQQQQIQRRQQQQQQQVVYQQAQTITLPDNYFPASIDANNGLVYGNTAMYDFQSYGNAPSQYTLVDPVSVLYTARRMSLYNVRTSALPINAISFQTAVNAI